MAGSDEQPERRRRGVRHRLGRVLWAIGGELKPRENRYRDVLLLIGLGLMLSAVVVAHNATGTSERAVGVATRATAAATQATTAATRALKGVQEGRSTSLAVICAVESAIGEAGHDVIAPASTAQETPFTRFLEQHGYPSLAKRQAMAKAAADAYVKSIARHVDRELRQRGKSTSIVPKLVRSNGTINCRVLTRIARVQPPIR